MIDSFTQHKDKADAEKRQTKEAETMISLFSQLPPTEQGYIIDYARFLVYKEQSKADIVAFKLPGSDAEPRT